MELNAGDQVYSELNSRIREIAKEPGEIVVREVFGHRYMGCGLTKNTKLTVHGTLGNDSACYMEGATLEVFGNAQDCIANTMNDGTLIVHGNCGDIMGYAMRGGQVYIQGYAGYRAGIHMKEYMDKVPLIVIGTKGGHFLGEYMAGGRIVVLGLGLGKDEEVAGKFFGTGMHGGKMYIRGPVNEGLMGREIAQEPLDEEDKAFLKQVVAQYTTYFGADLSSIKLSDFRKFLPKSKRPYGNMYIGN